MKTSCFILVALLALVGCNKRANETRPLADARKGFQTKLVNKSGRKEPLPTPPPGIFELVHYDSPAGKLAAYLRPDPNDGKQHPAIIWITGGDCNSIGDCWTPQPRNNDQSVSGFRTAGIILMFPSLRGGNNNPGQKEGFLGEVDDVIAAADYLARQPYVDPSRIYLGGHSTGGTLVLLVSECSDRFRAVFSFGPADDVKGYLPHYPEFLPFDTSNAMEMKLRSPTYWLASIKKPTFVFEGTNQGNIQALVDMGRNSNNKEVHFYSAKGATHFSILDPITQLIAGKILQDTGPTCNLSFTEAEVNKPFGN